MERVYNPDCGKRSFDQPFINGSRGSAGYIEEGGDNTLRSAGVI